MLPHSCRVTGGNVGSIPAREGRVDIMEKFSLLRPFDKDAAERGEAVCIASGGAVRWLGRSGNGRENIVERMTEGVGNVVKYAPDEWLRMAPLCWVEDKPVYKGDVLCHKTRGVRVIADRVNEEGYLCEALQRGGDLIVNLTWTLPEDKTRNQAAGILYG